MCRGCPDSVESPTLLERAPAQCLLKTFALDRARHVPGGIAVQVTGCYPAITADLARKVRLDIVGPNAWAYCVATTRGRTMTGIAKFLALLIAGVLIFFVLKLLNDTANPTFSASCRETQLILLGAPKDGQQEGAALPSGSLEAVYLNVDGRKIKFDSSDYDIIVVSPSRLRADQRGGRYKLDFDRRLGELDLVSDVSDSASESFGLDFEVTEMRRRYVCERIDQRF